MCGDLAATDAGGMCVEGLYALGGDTGAFTETNHRLHQARGSFSALVLTICLPEEGVCTTPCTEAAGV